MSDAFWTAMFAGLVTLMAPIVAAIPPLLFMIYKRVEEAKAASKANKDAIVGVAEANEIQHKKMNSELDEFKRIIKEAAKAEGVLEGRIQIEQEMKSLSAEALDAVAVLKTASEEAKSNLQRAALVALELVKKAAQEAESLAKGEKGV